MANLFTARRAIEQIALREGKNVEEVRAQIEEAMAIGLSSQDKKVQEMWAKVPRKGEIPTPDEFIEYISNGIVGGKL